MVESEPGLGSTCSSLFPVLSLALGVMLASYSPGLVSDLICIWKPRAYMVKVQRGNASDECICVPAVFSVLQKMLGAGFVA